MSSSFRSVCILVMLLMITQYACAPVLGASSYDGRIDIPEGNKTFWKINGDERLRFQVEVISGGPVDVYLTYAPPHGNVLPLEGYEYEGVYSVKDSYLLEGYFSVYLVVVNPEGPGTETDGNATVDVSWQVGTFTSWTTVLIITGIAFALSAVIGLIRSRRRRAGSYRRDGDPVKENVDDSETRGRPPSRPRTSGDPPGGLKWCRSCGGEMTWDGAADWWVCSYCGRDLGPGT